MPKGVEHTQEMAEDFARETVPNSVMPKGVERLTTACTVAVYALVPNSVMSKEAIS